MKRILALAVLAVTLLTGAGDAPAQQRRPPPAQVIMMTSPAWKDGDVIPSKHTQAGTEISPALAWTSAPEGTESFVLIMRDLDGLSNLGTDTHLYWMLWNIPKEARALPEVPKSLREVVDPAA